MPPSAPMIEVTELHKSYGSVHAVRGISFEVEAGTVCGFLGPNGAGKSTTLRILAGFLGATSGSVRVAGRDIVTERREAVRNIGYMPETCPLYPEMRVNEYLRFRSELKGIARRKRGAEVGRVLELAGVADMTRMRLGALSKGYRQRVGLADALLGAPPLLILDEPTAGLDPNQIQQVRSLVGRLREEHTILLSTHILPEVEAICERALVVHRGQLVAEGTLAELRRAQSTGQFEIAIHRATAKPPFDGDVDAIAARMRDLEAVAAVEVAERGGEELLVVTARDDERVRETTRRVVAALVERGVGVQRAAPVAASLEQIFAQLTVDHDEEPRGEDAAERDALVEDPS